ncbi:MAG TPA: hypothetical protein VGP55_01755 [Chitinophagaceae bacterium]|nr:hypothetical protein [Chitinophagaceae bacterium]
MAEGPQYTSCVQPPDFKPIDLGIIGALAIVSIATLFSGVFAVVAMAGIVQILRYVLDWMLNGKLICLHRDHTNGCNCGSDGGTVCVIGEIADTEGIGEDKNPVADVDNDFAINLMLAPFSVHEFWSSYNAFTETVDGKKVEVSARESTLRKATGVPHPVSEPFIPPQPATRPQGDLLRLQPGMPSDKGKLIFGVYTGGDGKTIFEGYFRTMIYHTLSSEYYSWTELFGKDYLALGVGEPDTGKAFGDYIIKHPDAKKFEAPVLHCEFEGSRIRDMLDVIEAFSLGGSWCKKNFFFRAICTLLQSVFAPIILIALAAAWANADDGNVADALEGGGSIGSKDKIILRGRWAYDGGHAGYNEVHATRTVQKVYNIPQDPKEFENFRLEWCAKMSEIPRVEDIGVHPLTPTEQATHDNQQKPENQWTFHPDIDGCLPNDDGADLPVLR